MLRLWTIHPRRRHRRSRSPNRMGRHLFLTYCLARAPLRRSSLRTGRRQNEWEPAEGRAYRSKGAGLRQPCGYHEASSPSQPNAGHNRPDFMHSSEHLYPVYVNLPGRFPVHRRNICAHKRVQKLYLHRKNTSTPSSLLNVQSSFRELNQRSTTAGYLNTLLRPVSPSS